MFDTLPLLIASLGTTNPFTRCPLVGAVPGEADINPTRLSTVEEETSAPSSPTSSRSRSQSADTRRYAAAACLLACVCVCVRVCVCVCVCVCLFFSSHKHTPTQTHTNTNTNTGHFDSNWLRSSATAARAIARSAQPRTLCRQSTPTPSPTGAR